MSQTIFARVFSGVFYGAVGGVLGIPASYFFQPMLFRLTVSFGDYLSHFPNVWYDEENGLGTTARFSMLVCAIIGVVIGGAVYSLRARENRFDTREARQIK